MVRPGRKRNNKLHEQTSKWMVRRPESIRTFLVLDLGLDVADGVAALDLERDRLPRQRLDEDLHPSSETQDKMKGGFLLDIVISQCAPILQLLPSKDEPLLIWRNPFLVL